MGLNWCDHGDAIVVYQYGACPLCEMDTENNELSRQLSDTEGRISDLESQIYEMEQEVEA